MQAALQFLLLFSFEGVMPLIVGVFNGEGPPVPIPNTEVKLTSADNTCLETDREDRSMPTRKAAACAAAFLRLWITSVDIAVTLNCDGNTIMDNLLSTDWLMDGLNFSTSTHPPVGLTQKRLVGALKRIGKPPFGIPCGVSVHRPISLRRFNPLRIVLTAPI